MRSSSRISALSLAAGLALTAACSGGGSDDSGSSTDIVYTVETVRTDAASAMAAIESVSFEVTKTGADVTIDDAGLVAFESADARFSAPSSADAVVEVLLLGNRVELGAIAIDGTLWLTDPLSGAWQDATGTIDFDPAKIFSTDTGVAKILESGLTDSVLDSAEPDGDGLLHLSGVVAADDVDTLTSGLVSEEARAEVAIDAETSLVQTISFDTPLDDGIATWLVELSDYDADVEIVPPDLDG